MYGSWRNGLAAARQQRMEQNCSKKIVVLKKHGSINEVWQLRFQIINRLTVLCERGQFGYAENLVSLVARED